MSGKPLVVVLNPFREFGVNGEREILERAGCEIKVVQAQGEDAVIEAIRDADGIFYTGPFTERMVEALEHCKVIARSAIGMDNFYAVDRATEKGIVLCNVPDVFVDEVANHTWMLILATARWLVPVVEAVKDGKWGERRGVQPTGTMHRLTDQTLGIIGLGNIGKAVAKRAAGFDMRVLACDPYIPKETFARYNATEASLARVLQDSDIVSLHVPLNDETHYLIGDKQFALMKKDAILINTCRGPVVDEKALIRALEGQQILAAGLDVTEVEPLDPESPLLMMRNVVITPHIASMSTWADGERLRRPAHEIAAVLTGHRPRAIWNPTVLATLNLQ